MMKLNVIEKISLQGAGLVNEDVCDFGKKSAWVIDGATGITKKMPVEKTDAFWYVSKLSNYIKLNISNEEISLHSILKDAIKNLKDEFKKYDSRPMEKYEYPSASIAVIRQIEGFLEYIVIGDCSIILDKNDKVEIISDRRISLLENDIIKKFKYYNDQNIYSISEIVNILLFDFKKMREKMNSKEGYWILSFEEKSVDNSIYGKVDSKSINNIIILTDGITRLIDVFKLYKADQLRAKILEKGLEEVCKELRFYEKEIDPDAKQFSRIKCTDDATGMVIKCN